MKRTGHAVVQSTLGLLIASAAAVAASNELGKAAGKESAYRVGPGDVLEIVVYDDPDLSRLVTVQYGGEITLPLLGEVPVADLTIKEIRDRLEEALGKDFLVDPQVIVRVKEYRSKWVTLVGEVARPGKYYLDGPRTLLDVLTEAGGFTNRASGEVVVTRLNGAFEDGSTVRRVVLSRDEPASEQRQALSLILKSGDMVTATGVEFFYISGEVKNPGSYPLTPGLTVLKAVSVAGGLTKFGSKGKVEILRKRRGKDPLRIKVDLSDIEKGKRPDVPLQAEDIVKVGKRIF